MFKDGFVWCDRCGKPIKLNIGVYFDRKHEYCAQCAPLYRNGTNPSVIKKITRWFKRWF